MGKQEKQAGEPQQGTSRISVKIGAIDIEYSGDDPEQFRQDVDAAMQAIFAPIRKLIGGGEE